MANTAPVFFVTESEYPKLQEACPDDFPFTYQQFVERVEDGIRQIKDSFTIEKTYADIAEFLAWCRESKIKPDNKARSRYAILLQQCPVRILHKRLNFGSKYSFGFL